MSKQEIVAQLAECTELKKKDVEAVFDGIVELIGKTLKKGQKVQLVGFGTFEVRKRSARTGRNPQTGETMKIKAKKVPAFKPGKQLKDLVA